MSCSPFAQAAKNEGKSAGSAPSAQAVAPLPSAFSRAAASRVRAAESCRRNFARRPTHLAYRRHERHRSALRLLQQYTESGAHAERYERR